MRLERAGLISGLLVTQRAVSDQIANGSAVMDTPWNVRGCRWSKICQGPCGLSELPRGELNVCWHLALRRDSETCRKLLLSLEVRPPRFPAQVPGAGPLLERATSAVSRRIHNSLHAVNRVTYEEFRVPPAVQCETCMTRERSMGIKPRINVEPHMIRPKPDRKQTPCQPPLEMRCPYAP